LYFLDTHTPNYYFQFSLNDHDKKRFEAKITNVQSRIKTFIELSNRLGKKRNLKDKGQRKDCGCVMSKEIAYM